MKTLSVRQPWVSLILDGIKDVENRRWSTSFRGTFALHSSASRSRADFEEAVLTYRNFADCDNAFAENAVRECSGGFLNAPCGYILGVCDLVDCKRAVCSPWHISGFCGFYLENPRWFKNPIPAKGSLGFWNADFDLDDALGVERKHYIGRAL